MKQIWIAFSLTALSNLLPAQTTFPINGVNDVREKYFAFIHANIATDYQTMITDATLVIKNGMIEAVGQNIAVPSGAVMIDLKGKFIYPSFIDLYSDYGIQSLLPDTHRSILRPQYESKKDGAYYWNQAIHPEVHADEIFSVKNDAAKSLRDLGFGTVVTHQQNGIIRGTGALVMLGEERVNEMILNNAVAGFYSFNKGNSRQEYPGSLMGSIALIRQTLYDAQWYKQYGSVEQYNISLSEISKLLLLPQIFQVNDVYSGLRADKIGDEFGISFIIKGDGDEYQRMQEVKASNCTYILPLNFPLAYNVTDPFDASQLSLSSMLHWELAPQNPAALEQAGVLFALTTEGLQEKKDFWKNLRKAIDYGLSEQLALKSLTYIPANLLGAYDEVGSITKGKRANFIICSDTIFNPNNIIYQNWVNGIEYMVNSYDLNDVRGTYNLKLSTLAELLPLEISGTVSSPEAYIKVSESKKLKVTFEKKDELITLSFHYPHDTSKQVFRLGGTINEDGWQGTAQDSDGKWISWSAIYSSSYQPKMDSAKKIIPSMEGKVIYPFVSYGNIELPKQQTTLFKNATVWTNEKEGIISNTDVLIQNGKITQIGKSLSAPSGTVTIDATGKHLTSGIIDEHSHIAAYEGLNEGSQSVSAEVRVQDVIYPNDINIYRQLSGGVTSSHILHGSANAIGGQTQLIKLRWGSSPEAMMFQNWPGFIKFALGENVKQSNWGDLNTIRFPQTRMGVEQIIFDAFIRARDYQFSWEKYNSLPAKEKLKAFPPRKDLELDALSEILGGKRFITCHSYVQSEINMLMHVADSMGFRVNTFTHILEGFKVADKMVAHGANASSFADWWSYKFEVYDAIPYNPAILSKVGVVTAVNSDDAEMARRLNQEAAKSILYGGLSEEEAWKLCTLNPAIMLHIDQWVGSIKAGKDADVVLWSDNPLSIYAKCEMTFVDGICFYSLEKDQAKQDWIQKEKMRLINKMLEAKQKGEPTQPVNLIYFQELDCETMPSEISVGN